MKKIIGLALGSGSARGLSHIGIIQELENIGIKPDIITGCSIGALVGASYAAGNLNKMYDWTCSLDDMQIRRYFSLNFKTGLINSHKIKQLFTQVVGKEDLDFKELKIPFATVATNLNNGAEIWLKDASVYTAVRSSMAFPGLLSPILYKDKWLVDGGLVNPVPVSLCFNLGADMVIAVNLNSDIIENFSPVDIHKDDDKEELAEIATESINKFSIWRKAKDNLKKTFDSLNSPEKNPPKTLDSISNSINIMQVNITRNKLATAGPNVLLAPRLSDIGVLEFHKAEEAIKSGRDCVKRLKKEIFYQLEICKTCV